MIARRGTETVALRDGAVIRSGDSLTIWPTVDRSAWVYLAYTDARGVSSFLYPTSGRGVLVHPGEEVRIPPPGQHIRVDDTPGEEHLIVIATEQPFDENDAELRGYLSRAVWLPPVPDPPVPDAVTPTSMSPPDAAVRIRHRRHQPTIAGDSHVGPRYRGFSVEPERSASDDAISLRADGEGTIAWRFDFHHAP